MRFRSHISRSPFTLFCVTFVHFRIRRIFVVAAPPISQTSRSWYSSGRDSDHPVSTTNEGFGIPKGRMQASGSLRVEA